MEELFKMFGFEDTEDIARNYGTMKPAEEPEVQLQTEHHELSQISDRAYWLATMEGTI